MVWKREGGVKFSHIKQNNNDFIQVPQILNLNLKIKYKFYCAIFSQSNKWANIELWKTVKL